MIMTTFEIVLALAGGVLAVAVTFWLLRLKPMDQPQKPAMPEAPHLSDAPDLRLIVNNGDRIPKGKPGSGLQHVSAFDDIDGTDVERDT